MLDRERIYARKEESFSRRLRGNTWFWCDKKVTRFFRKTFDRKHYNNLRAIYLALCEIDSDFNEGTAIRGFKRTLCTYSGRSMDTVSRYFLFLEQLELVRVEQFRDENGYFGNTYLYMAEAEDQFDEYFADPEWFNHILDSEELKLGKGYNLIKDAKTDKRLTEFPVNRKNGEPLNPVHKNNCDSNEENNSKNNLNIILSEKSESVEVAEITCGTLSNNVSSEQTQQKNKPTTLTKKQLCFKQRADRLAEIISSTRRINVNSNTGKWYKEIEKLHSIDGIELKRIDAALEWYSKNIGRDQYIPIVHAAATFREKFLKIEDAMARDASSKGNKRWGVEKPVAKPANMPYKNGVIRKSDSLLYPSDNDPDKMIDMSYDQAIELLKTNQPLPKFAKDFVRQIGYQEGILL